MPEKPRLYLINGPLGAGKTTVLKELLKLPPLRAARIIENEFASTSVDTEQLHDHRAEVRTIAGVCICCSTGDELTDALTHLSTDPAPVIIEATGVANSLQLIEKLVLSDMLEKYDIAHALFVLDGAEAMTDIDKAIERYATEMRVADTVLVSKTDLLSETSIDILSANLDSLGLVNVQFTYEGAFDYRQIERPSQIVSLFGQLDGGVNHYDDALSYTVIDVDTLRFDMRLIDDFWRQLCATFVLKRLKGDVVDGDENRWHIEATPSQIRVTKSTAPSSRLVLIGQKARLVTKDYVRGLL